MALNISVFPTLAIRQGSLPPAPLLSADVTSQAVALGAQSTALPGKALVCLLPDEDTRITASQAPGYAAPAATAIKLKGGAERYFELPPGTWYINAVAG